MPRHAHAFGLRLYLARAEVRCSRISPECGRNAQTAHVLAKRGYIQMSHFGPCEV